MIVHLHRRDALLLTMAGLAVLLIAPLLLLHRGGSALQGSIVDHTIPQGTFRVANLDYGEFTYVTPGVIGIMNCRAGTASGVTYLDPRTMLPTAGGKVYEYSSDYISEEGHQWTGKVARRGTGTLTRFAPGRAYAVTVEAPAFLRCSTPASTGAVVTDPTEITYTYGRWQRTALLHVPPSYHSGTSLPLVIALHGGGGNAAEARRTFKLEAVMDNAGAFVLYPQGTGAIVSGHYAGTWNAGVCCGTALAYQVDDVGYIRSLIDYMAAHYGVDATRVYVLGHSNGSLMAYRLACQLSDRIAGIAAIGSVADPAVCTPARRVPVLSIQGLADPCSEYGGGICGGCFNEFLQRIDVPVPEGATWACPAVQQYSALWAQRNGCSATGSTTAQGSDFTCVQYTGCAAPTTLCTLQSQGHDWPNGQWNGPCLDFPTSRECDAWKQTLLGTPIQDFPTAEKLWEFFAPLRLQ